MEPVVHGVFEPVTGTWQYVVADPTTKAAVIIDPVLDFDPARNTVSTKSADGLLALVREHGYTVDRLLETHIHADHLTAASYMQHRLPKKPDICIGKRIGPIQERFGRRYGVPRDEYDGAFNRLLDDDEVFRIGSVEAKAMHLPGHTPDHMGYLIGENIFSGDSLFNPDLGSARCDFPGGSATDLYKSATTLLSLPAHYTVRPGHDYPPSSSPSPGGGGGDGRGPECSATVADHRRDNKHLRDGTTEPDFVRRRTERDASLAEPRLLHASLQVNIRAGRLPRESGNGEAGFRLLHLPVRVEGDNGGWVKKL